MTTPVYIPTRSRSHLLEKTMPKWRKHDVEINLVIEPGRKERDEYKNIEADNILTLPEKQMGMGRIRQFILEQAEGMGQKAFVQADDDSYAADGHIQDLVDTVLARDVVGCGASSSYHGLMIGNKVLKLKTRFPIAGGYGHILFALNTYQAIRCGGYPSWATAWGEDTELQRQGIRDGMPWWYTTHVRMGSVAPRHSAGGLSAQFPGDKREQLEKKCHKKIHGIWPDYISQPGKRFACYWKRMMNDYCEGWEADVPSSARKALADR